MSNPAARASPRHHPVPSVVMHGAAATQPALLAMVRTPGHRQVLEQGRDEGIRQIHYNRSGSSAWSPQALKRVPVTGIPACRCEHGWPSARVAGSRRCCVLVLRSGKLQGWQLRRKLSRSVEKNGAQLFVRGIGKIQITSAQPPRRPTPQRPTRRGHLPRWPSTQRPTRRGHLPGRPTPQRPKRRGHLPGRPPRQPSTQRRIRRGDFLGVSAACSSPNSAVKVGDQLQPHCYFPLLSTHTASLMLVKQALVRDLWMWSTPAARRALSHPPVRTEHTPFRSSDLGCSTAPRRWAAIADSTRCICSWPHAKLASFLRLLLLLQHSSRMWRLIQSCPPLQSLSTFQPLSPFHRLNQYPLTITSSLGPCARVSSQVSPRQFHFARVIHNTANRLVTVTIPSLLTRSDLASFSGILVTRSLGFSFALSSVVCSSNSPPLLRVFLHHERLRLSVSAARARRGLRRTAPHSPSRARTHC